MLEMGLDSPIITLPLMTVNQCFSNTIEERICY